MQNKQLAWCKAGVCASLLHCFLIHSLAVAEQAQDCFFTDDRGVIKVTDSLTKIPEQYRSKAECRTARATTMVRPNQINLAGNLRSVDMATSLGRMELRWPRALEKIFSKTPERALADAARTVSRALKSGGFPSEMTAPNLTWRVVFLDQNLPEAQIPAQLVSNCHPGWMYPPADIFIVAQRVASGCTEGASVKTEKADAALARVLIHELGHAIEFALLKGKGRADPFRAEGFASWFEGYAARFSSLVDGDQIQREYRALGIRALDSGNRGYNFRGVAEDYGLASLYFRALEKKRGVSGLVKFYHDHLNGGKLFLEALRADFGWSDDKWQRELRGL